MINNGGRAFQVSEGLSSIHRPCNLQKAKDERVSVARYDNIDRTKTILNYNVVITRMMIGTREGFLTSVNFIQMSSNFPGKIETNFPGKQFSQVNKNSH